MSDFGLLATGILLAKKTSAPTLPPPLLTPAESISSPQREAETQPIEITPSVEVTTREFSPRAKSLRLEPVPTPSAVESVATRDFSTITDAIAVTAPPAQADVPIATSAEESVESRDFPTTTPTAAVTATPDHAATVSPDPSPSEITPNSATTNYQLSQVIFDIPSPTAAEDGTETSEDSMSQVTSVDQLSDVSSTDWAYQALKTLIERYQVLTGYPDGTFRGNQTVTRYEFAAALNAALEKISQIPPQGVPKEDLITLQRLQEGYVSELAELQGRVDAVEARTGDLERQQFSTTTRLFGQAIFGLQGSNKVDADLFPRDGNTERSGEANLTLGSNVQLTLATSFTGRDLLLTGLQAGNIASSAPLVFTNTGRLSTEMDTSNDLVLSDLSYRFPLSRNFGVVVGPVGVNPVNTFRGINPLEGTGEGAVSLLGQHNPILSVGNGTGGIGFDWQISRGLSLQGVYSAENPSLAEDSDQGGLFDGRTSAGVQLTIAPTNNIDIGLHYIYSHSPDGFLGIGTGDNQLISPLAPIISPSTSLAFNTHAVGATLNWRVNSRWTLGTWGGLTFSNPVELSGSVETSNWMVYSAFPDLFKKGNLAGVLFGQPPKITSSTLPDGFNFPNFLRDLSGTPGGRDDTSLHLELFYRAKLTEKISLTPGVLVILNPDHNAANNTLLVGILRATFQF